MSNPVFHPVMDDVRGVLFDFDGTLAHLNIDFAGMRAAVQRIGGEFGVDASLLNSKYTLEAIDAVVDNWRESPRGTARDFYEAAHQAIVDIEVAAARDSHLVAGVPDLFMTLRQENIRTGIVTRNCRQAVELILDGELPADVLLTREDVKRVKPDPMHLEVALQLLGTQATATLMVGDHPMDIIAGLSAGLRCVGVLTGNSPRERLEEAGAICVLDSVRDLLRSTHNDSPLHAR